MVRRGRVRKDAPAWRTALATVATYHFVCLTWVFFRAASVDSALELLGRIASLSVGFENVSPVFAATLLAGTTALFVRKEWSSAAMERFAESPFYVHAAALVLAAVALQSLGGRGSTTFVYSRF
jgi:hypothetical protein